VKTIDEIEQERNGDDDQSKSEDGHENFSNRGTVHYRPSPGGAM
jgi:hypothetical protein